MRLKKESKTFTWVRIVVRSSEISQQFATHGQLLPAQSCILYQPCIRSGESPTISALRQEHLVETKKCGAQTPESVVASAWDFGREGANSTGEIDAQPVAPTLIAPGHLSRGVTKLLLDVSLLDLGRRSEASAQRVTENSRARSILLRSPRTPAAIAARFASRATSLSFSRSDPTASLDQSPGEKGGFEPAWRS